MFLRNNIMKHFERLVSEVMFPQHPIWNFLVTGLLKHMSAATDTDFFGYKLDIRSNRHRIESGKAEAGVSFAVHP
jgi:hypothetical protein